MSPDTFASGAASAATTVASSSTLVVLPGLDGTDVFSRPFIAGLPGAVHARAVCYPASGPNRYADLLAHARSAVSDLPAFYLFGSSFGGPLALMLAAAEPARVKGVILSATFASTPLPQLAPFRFALNGPLIWALRAARRIPIWLKDPRDPLRIAKAETWSRTGAAVLAARARAALQVDVRPELQQCRAPVLCLSFDDDHVVPAASATELLRLCPAARRATLPGGHFAMFSDPAPVAGIVGRFIAETETLRQAA